MSFADFTEQGTLGHEAGETIPAQAFRTTFLAPGTAWVGNIVEFHKKFIEEYK